jgi:hypothetical protein
MGERGTFVEPNGNYIFLGVCCVTLTSRVQIAAAIVLAQHKRHKTIGKAQKPIRHASPIFPVINDQWWASYF